MVFGNYNEIVGYNFDNSQCFVRQDEDYIDQERRLDFAENPGYTPFITCPEERTWNIICCIPPLNFVKGTIRIIDAFQGEQPFILEEDRLKYRVIQVLVGIAELTVVGGWIVHGSATIYFYATK